MKLRRPKHPERVAIVGVGALVALNLAIFGYNSQDTSVGNENRPTAIQSVTPVEESVVRPQDLVGVDLRDEYQGMLTIAGRPIPDDQVEGDHALGQFYFRPGEGKEFRELPEGRIEVIVDYWAQTETLEEADAANEVYSYTWRFTVG